MKKYLLLGFLFYFCTLAFAAPVEVSIIKSNKPPIPLSQRTDSLLPTWSARNKEQGQLFLASNKLKPDVITLPSGIQYRIIKGGIGENPSINDTVTIKYQGHFISGKIFDKNFFNGKAITVPVSQLIPGLKRTVLLMRPGSLWEIYIPPSLAYGEQGLPGVIGPNMTLIYFVYVVGVQYKNPPPTVETNQSTQADQATQ